MRLCRIAFASFGIAIALSGLTLLCFPAPSQSAPAPEEYVFVKDTNRWVMVIQGKSESIGKLDETGNFIPDKRWVGMKRGQYPASVPNYEVINASAQKRIYEYRSGRLLLGEMDEEGNFIPAVGAKITDFKDYTYSPEGPKIYNLPGKFFRKSEKEEASRPIKLVYEKRDTVREDGSSSPIHSIAYAPDGKTMAWGANVGRITVWSNGKNRALVSLPTMDTDDKFGGGVYSLAYSPDSKTLILGCKWKGKPTVRILDVATSKMVADLDGPRCRLAQVAISPDAKWLAAAGGIGDDTGDVADEYKVIIWDFATRKRHGVLAGHLGRRGIGGLAFAPDSETLAVSCADGSIKLWKVSTGEELATIAKAGGSGLAFASDGKTLFAGAGDEITLIDMAKHKVRDRWKFSGTDVGALALSKDGKLLAAAGARWQEDGRVYFPVGQIRDAGTGKVLADLTPAPKDRYFLAGLAFSPDGKMLAGAGSDMMIHLWKLDRGPADQK